LPLGNPLSIFLGFLSIVYTTIKKLYYNKKNTLRIDEIREGMEN